MRLEADFSKPFYMRYKLGGEYENKEADDPQMKDFLILLNRILSN